jgi:hypothetical protein
MQRVNEFEFYDLGTKIHPIGEKEEVLLREVWFEWYQARESLDTILSLRPLSVSVAAARKLSEAITAFIPEKWDDLVKAIPPLKEGEEETPVKSWQTFGLRTAAKEFETVLAAECQVLDTYFVSKKGVYSTADLIDHAHYHIPEPTRSELPDLTKGDFDQAGKCMAFDLATAAAFHLLRGTEAVVRQYYELVVPGMKRAPAKMRNWGVYIKLLKDHGAEEKITSLLTHLKDAYRNPVFHPEENYTDERVQVLFGVCISAIVLMVEEITKLKPKSELLPFSAALTGLSGLMVSGALASPLSVSPEATDENNE